MGEVTVEIIVVVEVVGMPSTARHLHGLSRATYVIHYFIYSHRSFIDQKRVIFHDEGPLKSRIQMYSETKWAGVRDDGA